VEAEFSSWAAERDKTYVLENEHSVDRMLSVLRYRPRIPHRPHAPPPHARTEIVEAHHAATSAITVPVTDATLLTGLVALQERHEAQYRRVAEGFETFDSHAVYLDDLNNSFACQCLHPLLHSSSPSTTAHPPPPYTRSDNISISRFPTRSYDAKWMPLSPAAARGKHILRNNNAIDVAIHTAEAAVRSQFLVHFVLPDMPVVPTALDTLYAAVSTAQFEDFNSRVGNFSYVALYPVRESVDLSCLILSHGL
jgi:hypothetical protein